MNLQTVLAQAFAPITQTYTWRDSALYALALGMASDPLDAAELPYVYEGAQAGWGGAGSLRAVPSMCVTLGWLPLWQREPQYAIAWERIVHGEMQFTLHQPLATEGQVVTTHRIAAVQDKGVERGALIHTDKELMDAHSGAAIASLRSVEFLRGDGGCGDWGEPRELLAPLPPDFQVEHRIDLAMPRSAALLYRLASRDLMLIHADPAIATQAGFERPISHGLNNLGLACRAVLKQFAVGQGERLHSLGARFTAPGLPGDTVRVEMQRRGASVYFRARALERDVLLLDRGVCGLRQG